MTTNGENENPELADYSSYEEETERSPKTLASLANIARRKEAIKHRQHHLQRGPQPAVSPHAPRNRR